MRRGKEQIGNEQGRESRSDRGGWHGGEEGGSIIQGVHDACHAEWRRVGDKVCMDSCTGNRQGTAKKCEPPTRTDQTTEQLTTGNQSLGSGRKNSVADGCMDRTGRDALNGVSNKRIRKGKPLLAPAAGLYKVTTTKGCLIAARGTKRRENLFFFSSFSISLFFSACHQTTTLNGPRTEKPRKI